MFPVLAMLEPLVFKPLVMLNLTPESMRTIIPIAAA
jgi:hypothetical protein